VNSRRKSSVDSNDCKTGSVPKRGSVGCDSWFSCLTLSKGSPDATMNRYWSRPALPDRANLSSGRFPPEKHRQEKQEVDCWFHRLLRNELGQNSPGYHEEKSVESVNSVDALCSRLRERRRRSWFSTNPTTITQKNAATNPAITSVV